MNHTKKVYMRLQGRLGNQLFQLALALSISQKFKVEVLLDDQIATYQGGFERFLFEELQVFNYFKYCSSLRLFTNRVHHNSNFRRFFKSNDIFIESEADNCESALAQLYKSYTGFFQSPSLFPEKDILSKAFSLRNEFICKPLSKLLYLAEETESLAISVRRGDFVGLSHLGVCSEQYYLNAVNFVRGKRTVDCIFVFSDDIPYCRQLLGLVDCEIIYVEGFTPAKSLSLMSQCKHFVIANSTFSWWGAWLSAYQEKVVVSPHPWNDKDPVLSDFLPPDWARLPKHPSLKAFE
jgi:Glycosyl transferase family 11